eukprot:4209253-Heterocapsa_arctica.AAC.1
MVIAFLLFAHYADGSPRSQPAVNKNTRRLAEVTIASPRLRRRGQTGTRGPFCLPTPEGGQATEIRCASP